METPLTDAATADREGDGLLERHLIGAIITSFYRVYDELGFGFLESVYCRALQLELQDRGVETQREAVIDVHYKSREVGHFRVDLLVDRRVIVEVKASEMLAAVDRKQLLNYLRGSSLQVGLLLHFGPKASFQRLVYTETARRS